MVEWYPWLNYSYKNIIDFFLKKISSCTLIIHSQSGNGEKSLCYAISRWLICNNPVGIKSCGICKSCKLMLSGNHPDYYFFSKIDYSFIEYGIENIRFIIDNIQSFPKQGKVKVIWIPYCEFLTEEASNALLKIIEEIPQNTYFLLHSQEILHLSLTLKSRCLYWILPTPEEKIGLNWLKENNKKNHNNISCYTALKLCNGAPVKAKKFLQSENWKNRLNFCEIFSELISKNKIILLFDLLKISKKDEYIYWLLTLLSDALKLKKKIMLHLVNIDMLKLIKKIANNYSSDTICNQWVNFINFRKNLREINGINYELLLFYYLTKWK